MTYFIFEQKDCKFPEQKMISNPAVYPDGIIYGNLEVLTSSGLSGIILTEIEVLRSFRMLKV